MNKIIKKISVLVAILLLFINLVFLTGCAKKQDVRDIKNYIENTIGIRGYTLSNTAEQKNDKDGYTDYYWHVKYKAIEFDVIDNYYYGMESVTNTLQTDFDQKVLSYYYGNYPYSSNITYSNDLVYDKYTLISEAADEDGNINEQKLRIDYNNIVIFLNTIDFKQYPVKRISVEVVSSSNKHVKWLTIYQDGQIKSFDQFKQ